MNVFDRLHHRRDEGGGIQLSAQEVKLLREVLGDELKAASEDYERWRKIMAKYESTASEGTDPES